MSYISFYVTFPDKDTATKIIHQVVLERLAACGNTFLIDSCYIWQEKLYNEEETAAIIKTSISASSALLKRIEELHPYEVPCISYWQTDANKSYEKWIEENTINYHGA